MFRNAFELFQNENKVININLIKSVWIHLFGDTYNKQWEINILNDVVKTYKDAGKTEINFDEFMMIDKDFSKQYKMWNLVFCEW